jgi:putative hydrolase of HD superfamily
MTEANIFIILVGSKRKPLIKMHDISQSMDVNSLMREAGKLKKLKRTGWVESRVPDPESVADHSYRVALLAMAISDKQDLDTLKTVRMALLHDLAESTVGDLTPRQKQGPHEKLESDAMMKILASLPEKVSQLYSQTWKEYQQNETPEARLVHNADKIEMLTQAKEYESKGSKLDQFWETEIDPEYEKYKPKRG